MTDEEHSRLMKLDNLIAWNNPTDGGRGLTSEEQEEHSRLFRQAMREHEKRITEAETMNGFTLLADNYRKFLENETDKRIITETEKKIKTLDFLATCDTKEKCFLFDSSAFNEIFLGYTDNVINDLLEAGELTPEQASKIKYSFSGILNAMSADQALEYYNSHN